jgi:transposase
MLTVNHYARIRGAYRDGMSICEIARRFHHSRRKVRAVLKGDGEPAPYPERKGQHYRKLGKFLGFVDEILSTDDQAPRKQRHTAMRIFERLTGEGYEGGYDAVRRYVAKRRRKKRETFIPLSHDPGQRLEADFGQIYVDFPEGRLAVWVLILVWSHSNCPFAIALPTQRTEAILEGMVRGFEYFGCVAREVWWDNPKTVATELLTGRERRLHPRYAALASHYVFDPLFCMPARGNEKPYVENRVKTLQRRWSTPVPKVRDFDELNAYLLRCCQADRQRNRNGTDKTIGEVFEQDREAASALPRHAFDPCVMQPGMVDKYQLVHFDKVLYSVPRAWAFETVTVKGYVDRVDIVVKDRLIASHRRSYESRDQVLDPLHYLVTLGRRPAALDHSNVYRRWKLPAAFEQLRGRLEKRHGSRPGVRQYIRVLQLLAEHPLKRVQYVIECLCGDEELDAAWITRRVAERAARDAGKTSTNELDGQRPEVSQVSVPDPDLTVYDHFLLHGGNCDEQDECDGRCEPAPLEGEPETVATSDDPGRVREACPRSGRVEPDVRGVSSASDGVGGIDASGQCTCVAHPPGVVPGGEGPGQLRLLCLTVDQQAEDLGAVAWRVDRQTFQYVFYWPTRHGENPRFDCVGDGSVPCGPQGAVLHGRVVGKPSGGSAEAVPTGSTVDAVGPDGPVDLRRAGVSLVQPDRRGVAVPGLCRPLRAEEPADHKQPSLQRLGADLSRRADDGGAAGSSDPSLRDISDERRKLPLPRVDEKEGRSQGEVALDQFPSPPPPSVAH